jgi:hypothetical protein
MLTHSRFAKYRNVRRRRVDSGSYRSSLAEAGQLTGSREQHMSSQDFTARQPAGGHGIRPFCPALSHLRNASMALVSDADPWLSDHA